MDATAESAPATSRGSDEHAEVVLVARGIATAVAPEDGLTDVQASLLEAIASALTGFEVDYHGLEPLGLDELASVLADKDDAYRQRIVHHMVLGELVLRPLPPAVALRVAKYSQALGVDDKFVRVARRYAQGAFGLAWLDLRRSGFTEHLQQAQLDQLHHSEEVVDAFAAPSSDDELAAEWIKFEGLPEGTLGRSVWEMYDLRGFPLPGVTGGPSPYLAQHDFVHVIADYGTNLKGELEVFAFIGRADPDPKGFAWLATLIGLFETGYVEGTGFFDRDVKERHVQAPGMDRRVADAIRRGRVVCDANDQDLFDVDYHELAPRQIEEVRAILQVPEKGRGAREAGSKALSDREGMSETQQRYVDERAAHEGGHQ